MTAQDTAKRGQVSDMKPTADTTQNTTTPPQDAILAGELQVQIGRQLRAVYDEVVEEGADNGVLQEVRA